MFPISMGIHSLSTRCGAESPKNENDFLFGEPQQQRGTTDSGMMSNEYPSPLTEETLVSVECCRVRRVRVA